MITFDILSLLCCPACRSTGLQAEITKKEGELFEEGHLVCDVCQVSYPVQAGVPDLTPRGTLSTNEWQMWKNHLEGFEARREQRAKKPSPVRRGGKKKNRAFFDFVGITEGSVLDVGCGPGKLRNYLDESRVTYYGLDPLPMPEASGFYYVKALAEYIPFHQDTFSCMIVCEALDHFSNQGEFFKEAVRVLKPDGKLHILQSIHEITGPIEAVRMLAHVTRDAMDSSLTKVKNPEAPKHVTDFTKSSLLEVARDYLEVIAIEEYSSSWYTPNRLFISLSPKGTIAT